MNMHRVSRYATQGFTLIEMLMTVALIGVLASVAVPMMEISLQRDRERELRETLRTVRRAIDAYKQAVDEGRIEQTTGDSGYPPSLEVLVDGVPDQRDPQRSTLRFLRQVPRDPLQTNTSVPASNTWGKRSYASSHDRPMAGKDVFDVYSLASGSGLNGIPYKQW
jgi:general secretion pathway protein G